MGSSLIVVEGGPNRCGTLVALCTALAVGLPFVGSAAFAAGLPGDACPKALVVSDDDIVTASTTNLNNWGASTCGSSGVNADIWYAYTNSGACDVEITASTCGGSTDFDTVLSVFESCSGPEIACNDDGPDCPTAFQRASTLTWTVPATTTHWIRVSGFLAETGDFELSLSRAPDNDTCGGAAPVTDGVVVGETRCKRSTDSTTCESAGPASRIVAPVAATASTEFSDLYLVQNLFDAAVSEVDLDATAYGFADGQYAALGGDADLFLDFGATMTFEGLAYSQRQGGIPGLDKVGTLQLWFADSNFGGVIPMEEPHAEVAVTNVVNTIMTSYGFPGASHGGRYAAVRMLPANVSDPGNIGGSELRFLTASGSSPDAWHAYSNPTITPMLVTATTCGIATDFDTTLAAYESCGSAQVGCNDDASCPASAGASEMTWIVPPQQTHRIRVAGAGTDSGAYELAVSGVATNDRCEPSTLVPVEETRDAIVWTTNATASGPLEPSLCSVSSEGVIDADVWFEYESLCDGKTVVDLCGSDYDSMLAVYDGTSCPLAGDTAIRCNDDACGATGYQSAVVFPSSVGGRYLLRVGGWRGAEGVGRLTIECLEPGDIDDSLSVDLADHLRLTDCLYGPGVRPRAPGIMAGAERCLAAFDFDTDGDVDLQDAGSFGTIFMP